MKYCRMSICAKPMQKKSKHSLSMFISALTPPLRCSLKLAVRGNHRSFDEYIYISASALSDVTRLPTEFPQTQENTHLGPNPYFLLVENNYRSDRPVWPTHHTIMPAVPYLVRRLTQSVGCAGEARLCLLSLWERWWPAHRVPLKALISAARHQRWGRSAI